MSPILVTQFPVSSRCEKDALSDNLDSPNGIWYKAKTLHSLHSSSLKNSLRKKERKSISVLHCKPIPVMKTGISLCSISNREKPVFINWEPCNENRFFPVWKYYTGKTLFCPCTGPIRDCSVVASKPRNSQYLPPLNYVHTKPILPKSYGLDPAVQCNMSLKRL